MVGLCTKYSRLSLNKCCAVCNSSFTNVVGFACTKYSRFVVKSLFTNLCHSLLTKCCTVPSFLRNPSCVQILHGLLFLPIYKSCTICVQRSLPFPQILTAVKLLYICLVHTLMALNHDLRIEPFQCKQLGLTLLPPQLALLQHVIADSSLSICICNLAFLYDSLCHDIGLDQSRE